MNSTSIETKNEVVIFGCSGHAKVVADIIFKSNKYNIKAFVDVRIHETNLFGIPIISEKYFFSDIKTKTGIVAIGDNYTRQLVTQKIISEIPDFIFSSAIHPSSQIGQDTTIGPGTVIMSGTSINSSVSIGSHCIINTGSSVDHDCIIEDFVSIAPGSSLGGNCIIGKSSIISIGSTLIHNIKIGKDTLIGAGSLVIKNIPDFCVAYGSPAKKIRNRNSSDKYL